MSSEQPTLLRTDYIIADPDVQPRVSMSKETIEEYAEAIKQDAKCMPPVTAFFDGSDYWLADGFHRHAGYELADCDHIPCVVKQGSKRDAMLFALGCNATHGLKRTNADKRAAVLKLLNDQEWSKWSTEEIARRACVDPQTVANHRKAISRISGDATDSEVANASRTVSRGGTTYQMNTGSIGSKPLGDAPKSNAHKGQSRVNGVLQDDPDDIAEQRAQGLIPQDVIPEITGSDDEEEGETVESIRESHEERRAIQAEITDQEWLDQLPLSSKLKNKPLRIFQADALVWRHSEKARDTFKRVMAPLLNKSRYLGVYGSRVNSFLSFKPPHEWKSCPPQDKKGCNGSGTTPIGDCSLCRGRGYLAF